MKYGKLHLLWMRLYHWVWGRWHIDYHHSKDKTSPIHAYSGLSYGTHLIVPRKVLQSMPVKWQQRFVACLEELDQITKWDELLPEDYDYEVQLVKREEFDPKKSNLGRAIKKLAEEAPDRFEWEWEDDVLVRVRVHHDPLMDYERGRARIPIDEKLAKRVS